MKHDACWGHVTYVPFQKGLREPPELDHAAVLNVKFELELKNSDLRWSSLQSKHNLARHLSKGPSEVISINLSFLSKNWVFILPFPGDLWSKQTWSSQIRGAEPAVWGHLSSSLRCEGLAGPRVLQEQSVPGLNTNPGSVRHTAARQGGLELCWARNQPSAQYYFK